MQEIREFKCFKINGFAVLVLHLPVLTSDHSASPVINTGSLYN
jgi:hypothetical protein